MEELVFFDVKGKKKFKSSEYTIVEKKGRFFAISDAPSGIKAYRIIANPNKKKIIANPNKKK